MNVHRFCKYVWLARNIPLLDTLEAAEETYQQDDSDDGMSIDDQHVLDLSLTE